MKFLSEDTGNLTLPKSRTKDLVVQSLKNETLVYDLKSNKAHNLNETVAFVWNRCDGNTNLNQIVKLLTEKLNTKIDIDFVSLALNELYESSLLETRFELENKVTRRSVLLNYALPTIALPIVLSLAAPTPAQTTSCQSTVCTTDADCLDPARPFCINNCCSASPIVCTSDSDCTDPVFPTCVNNMCVA